MKSIIISIKPKYVAEILNGKKTIEVRKTAPKCELPCEVYIYCTKNEYLYRTNKGYFASKKPLRVGKGTEYTFAYSDEGMVVAKFTLNEPCPLIKKKNGYAPWCGIPCFDLTKEACLTQDNFDKYLKGKNGYGWHIDDLVIFDKPKELRNYFVRDKKGDIPIQIKELKGSKFMAIKRIEHAPQSWCYCEAEE